MKEYKVRKEIAPHLIFVLERDKFQYQYYHPKDSDYYFFLINAGSKCFKILLEDAYCEEERHSHISCIPVYSERTLKNRKKLERLKKLNGCNGFVLWNKVCR